MNSTALGDIRENSIGDVHNCETIKNIRKHILNNEYAQAGCKSGCPLRYRLENKMKVDSFPIDWQQAAQEKSKYQENYTRFIDAIDHKLIETTNLPLFVDIQPIEACNMGCIMCHQQHGKKDKIAANVISTFLSWPESLYAVQFQGGEVFLDPQLTPFLLELKKNLMPFQIIRIITNGSLISDEAIQQLTAPPNPVRFIISIDAIDEKVYKHIRKSPLFTKVWNTLTTMAEIQKSQNRKDIIRWNFVVMKSNFHLMKEALYRAADLGVVLTLNPIIGPYPEENIFDYHNIRPDRALEYVDECIQLATSLNTPTFSLTILRQKLDTAVTI